MAKLMKILTVVQLLLAVAALTFGVMLFRKREILQGRTRKLERAVMALAATIEEETPVVDEPARYPARDIDRVTAEPIDDPVRSDFWDSYRQELERTGAPTIDLTKRTAELMNYYKIDPLTGKPAADPSGRSITEGPGTMQHLLDGVTKKSLRQLNRLEETRGQLREVREELVACIGDVNRRKHDLRFAMRTIDDRDGMIAQLEQTIRGRDEQIALCEEEILDLSDTVQEHERVIEDKNENIYRLKRDVKVLEHVVAKLKGEDQIPRGEWDWLIRGRKGSVAAVSTNWHFVVVDFDDEFVKQYSEHASGGETHPGPDLTVMRESRDDGIFISKVKLNWLDAQNGVGVADVLIPWKQTSIRQGDVILY